MAENLLYYGDSLKVLLHQMKERRGEADTLVIAKLC
jgi:hypothetical protein